MTQFIFLVDLIWQTRKVMIKKTEEMRSRRIRMSIAAKKKQRKDTQKLNCDTKREYIRRGMWGDKKWSENKSDDTHVGNIDEEMLEGKARKDERRLSVWCIVGLLIFLSGQSTKSGTSLIFLSILLFPYLPFCSYYLSIHLSLVSRTPSRLHHLPSPRSCPLTTLIPVWSTPLCLSSPHPRRHAAGKTQIFVSPILVFHRRSCGLCDVLQTPATQHHKTNDSSWIRA